VIEIDRRENDPCDLQNAECHAVKEAQSSKGERHMKEHDRHNESGRRATHRTPVRLDLESREQREQNNDRQCSHKSGQPPMSKWVVYLCPIQTQAPFFDCWNRVISDYNRQYSRERLVGFSRRLSPPCPSSFS